jgi:phage-related protein
MGSSYDDLIAMPEDVQDQIGYALDLAQHGKKAAYAKPMHGRLGDVMEVVANDDNRTFRGAYTTTFADVVYVLDVFVKIHDRQQDPHTGPRPYSGSVPASEGAP